MVAVARIPRVGIRRSADAALTELYAAQWAPMVRLAYLLVRDQQVAEDVVQDALISIHRRWDDLADQDRAVAYLRRSVVNGARSVLRHRKVVHEKLAVLGDASMLRALDGLPRRQREVLVLRYWLDLSEAQIADTLEISPGSVKAHASRAMSALRSQLTAQAPAPGAKDDPR